MRRWIPWIVLAVALAAGGLAGSARSAFPGYNGKLVFVGSSSSLEVYDPLTGQVAPLAGRTIVGARPSWSPDGHLVAFVGTGDRIGVVDALTGGVTQVTGDLPAAAAATWPSWSPDGRSILFACPPLGICVVGRDGTGLHTISPAPADAAAWSPDGDRIAYSVSAPSAAAEHGLWVAGADGSGAKMIFDTSAESLGPPSWSPDGKWLAIEDCEDSEPGYLSVVRADGASETSPVRTGRVCAGRAAWSPDGRFLVYRLYRSDQPRALVVVGTDGMDGHFLLDPASGQPLLGQQPDWERRETPATRPIPAPNPPSVASPPTISGPAVVGATLTASPGTWNGDPPVELAYRWERCDAAGCAASAGATAAVYEVRAEDVSRRLRVSVTARNVAGSATAVSEPTVTVTREANGAAPRVNAALTIRSAHLVRRKRLLTLRMTTCDDAAGRVSVHVTDWDAVGGRRLGQRRHVWTARIPQGCSTSTRSWTPAARRHALHVVSVQLRDVDGAWSRRLVLTIRLR